MAKVIALGEPVNESERMTIALLRDSLPDTYLVMHNFELLRDGEPFEIDLALLAPHAIYLVDAKGTRGTIHVHEGRWHPAHPSFRSPLAKLRGHAKRVKSLITESQPARRELEDIYVDAAVVLTAPDAALVDPAGLDGPHVTTLKKAAAFFQDVSRVPPRFHKHLGALYTVVLNVLRGKAKPRSAPPRFRSWEVTAKLGATDHYTEYRAFDTLAGPRVTATLRVYKADPYLPPEDRAAQAERIKTAYLALAAMQGHPNIAGAREFFEADLGQYVLVTEDVSGQSLRVHIDNPALPLTFEQKARVARDLLDALAHLQRYKVVHRNLTPSTLVLGTDGRVRLTGFEFARAGADRSHTIAGEIVDDLDPRYQAPETYRDPGAASHASDVFAAGLVLYELFTGARAFKDATEVFDRGAAFTVSPRTARPELPEGIDAWLQRLCAFEKAERPEAATALEAWAEVLAPRAPAALAPTTVVPPVVAAPVAPSPDDYYTLPARTALTRKYVIEKRLGRGSYGVVYKVIDTLGDVARAMKIIVRDRHSVVERLKTEYRALLPLPEHPRIVRLIDADFLPGDQGLPFLVFEYVDGLDVGEMIDNGIMSPEDVLTLGRQVLEGLVHLHQHGVWHQDIKPRNLMWTDRGVKIIDFNVAVAARTAGGRAGGTWRYLPPDLDTEAIPTPADRIDRDLYALGLTLYEALAGYPWAGDRPPPGAPPPDPRTLSGSLARLAPEFVAALCKAIAPRRAERFGSAVEMLSALASVPSARRAEPVVAPEAPSPGSSGGAVAKTSAPANTNPYVRHLLTVYSQSRYSNAGTRGLDALSEQTYVETALDRELLPAVIAGEFRLVVITGNAGDGKTAFLQTLERRADGGEVQRPHPNQGHFAVGRRRFVTNHDGSQDEGERANDEVLRAFFAPFAGGDPGAWPADETRLIAINEGRLVDFFESRRDEFPALAALVRRALETGAPEHGVVVTNLNARSVVVDPGGGEDSILERLVRRMTHESFWEPCERCDLRDRCYARHNALTFQDETAGPRALERLKTLYAVTHLRGQMHVTLRDLRSALAFTLVGTRDCDEIHALYQQGRREDIIQGFYFNAWMGGDGPNADRLLALLRDVDVADCDDPRLDRSLDFTSPDDDQNLFHFERRGSYDREVLRRLFTDLPRGVAGVAPEHRSEAHRWFLGMARRRFFFNGPRVG